jgi:hypothetical protein
MPTPTETPVEPAVPVKSRVPVLSIVVVLIVIAIAAAGGYYVMRAPVSSVQKSVSTPEPKQAPSPFELRALRVVTEADYATAFEEASGTRALLADGYTDAAGAFVKLEDDKIQVRLPGTIPNMLLLPDGKADVRIHAVSDASGASLFDPKSSLETDAFFTAVDLKELSEPVYHFAGSRTISLVSGADPANVATASGEVVLQLPVGLSTLSMMASDTGRELKGIGKATLSHWEVVPPSEDADSTTTNVTVSYDGFQEKLIGIEGFDAAGKQLDTPSRSSLGRQGLESDDYDITFDGVPSVVKVFEADHVLTKSFPFTVSNASSMPTSADGTDGTASGTASGVNQDVIDAAVHVSTVLTSEDPKQIRDLLHQVATAMNDAEKLTELKKMTDKDVLDLASTLNDLSLPGTPDQIRTEMQSTRASWKWAGADSVDVTYRDTDGTSYTQTFQRSNGVWF